MTEPDLRILSLGAGRQSTALFILGCEGKVLPKLDMAVFADTQWEPRHVMRHLENLQRFGEEHGIPVYMATKGSLPDDVLNRRVFATIPSYTRLKSWENVPVAFGTCTGCTGEILTGPGEETCPDCANTRVIPVRWEKRLRRVSAGRIKRQCTAKYKVEVIDSQVRLLLGARQWDEPCRYCSATGTRIAPWDPDAGEGPCSICRGTGTRRRVGPVAGPQLSQQWIGFSADEIERVTDANFPRYERPWHPLLELGWTVSDCEQFLHERGWQAAKSACIGCPFHDDDIWIDMKHRDPDDFADAVEFDRAHRTAAGLEAERFLHESRLPLDEAVAREERRRRDRGEQLVMFGERPRKRPRGCSPYGCRTSELADDSEAGAA